MGFLDRRFWWLAGALLALHAGLAWYGRSPGILPEWDQARYAVLARTLAGFRYVDAYLPDPAVHQLYPPGYPALLALWGTIVGWRYDLLVALSVACSTGALALAAAMIRRRWAALPAVLTLAVLAVSPEAVQMAGLISSEPPFMLATLLGLALVEADRPRRAVGAAVSAIAAGLVRTAGVTFAGALALEWMLRRRWRAAALFALAAGLTVGGWLAWTALAPTQHIGTSYIADLTRVTETAGHSGEERAPAGMAITLARRVADQVPQYLAIDIPLSLPLPTLPGTVLDNLAIAGLVTISLVLGIVVMMRRWRVAALYLVAYAAMLAVWPWRHARFLVPILPLIVLGVLTGFGALARAVRPRWETAAMLALAAFVAVTGVAQGASGPLARWRGCPHGRPIPEGACLSADASGFLAALRFIRDETPDSAVFLTSKSPELYWYTGRRSIRREDAMAQTPDAFATFLKEAGVDYVLLASVHAMDLERLPTRLQPRCADFRVAFARPPSTYLLAVPDSAAPPDSAACQALEAHRRANLNRTF